MAHNKVSTFPEDIKVLRWYGPPLAAGKLVSSPSWIPRLLL